MVTTPNFDLDIDTTLGGNNASDYIIPSQKAIKSYVDNNIGGGGTVDQIFDGTSANAQSGIAIAGAGFLQTKGAITSSTVLTSLATGIYTVDGVTHAGFPNPSQAYYGVLIQYGGTYKPQLLVAGVPASNGLYYRRYLTGSSSFTAWGSIPTVPTNILQNTATGTNALTLLGTATNQSGSINIGYGSSVTNSDSVVIGENAESAYSQTVAIGYQANANDSSSTAIGYGAYTNYSQATAIGTSAQATKAGTVAVGASSQATQTQANAFGYNAQSTGYGSIALGYGAQASANYAIQLGNGTNSTASTLAVGFNGTDYTLLDGTTGLIPDGRINSKLIDGQWVSSYLQIDSTTSIHSTKHNLGTTGTGALNYLPADCTTYKYEVFVVMFSSSSSSNLSHGYAANNSTATNGQYGRISCNANSRHADNSFSLEVTNGEMWTSVGDAAFGQSFGVVLAGYRRLGTNS